MGMDGVEIVMLTEERFGIEISDSEAEKIRTAGMLIDLVQAKIALTSEKACQSQKSFYLLRRAVMRLTNTKRASLRPTANLRQFVEPEKEMKFWPELQTAIGARSWPPLGFSQPVEHAVKATAIGIGVLRRIGELVCVEQI